MWPRSLLTLAITTSVKACVRRARPAASSVGPRRVSLRHLESNHAWPSGDSAQAALFTVLTVLLAEGWLLGLLMVPLVMFSRVYFGFHWFGDTLGGAAIGATVAWTVLALSELW